MSNGGVVNEDTGTLAEIERDVILEAAHPSRPDREALLIAAVERIVAARGQAARSREDET